MKRLVLVSGLLFGLLASSGEAHAFGLEAALGGWHQSPSGEVAYKPAASSDTLDIDDDLNFDSENRPYGRLKVDLPLFFPNIYLMYTPMEFSGTGQKNVSFTFGDETFNGNVDFDSKVVLNHYDIGLFYGLPFLETATAKKVNIDLGINVRIYNFSAEVTQDDTGIEEEKSLTVPVPMAYAAFQIRPMERLSIEAEGRGIAYSDSHFYSVIGRIKVKALGPMFVAGGYRYDSAKIDEEDVEAEFSVGGPFAEVGVEF